MLTKQIKIISAGNTSKLEVEVNEWLLKAEPFIFAEEIIPFSDGLMIIYKIDDQSDLDELRKKGLW